MELKAFRNKKKKTQQECAKELGITVQYFSELERKNKTPSLSMGERLISWSGKKIRPSDLWPVFKN